MQRISLVLLGLLAIAPASASEWVTPPQLPATRTAPPAAAISADFDLSAHVTIFDQGTSNALSFIVPGAVEIAYAATGKPTPILSRKFIAWVLDAPDTMGSYLGDGVQVAAKPGLLAEADFSSGIEDDKGNSRETIFALAAEKGYRIHPATLTTSEQIVAALGARQPVLATIIVDEEFFAYQAGIYHSDGQQFEGAHVVTVVGYDADTDAFKFANSWGTGWGEQGFGWIDAASFAKIRQEAYAFAPAP